MVTTRLQAAGPRASRAMAAIAVVAVLISASGRAIAQGRSTTADPASQVTSFDVGGIHVIMAPAYNQLVSVVIGLDGGIASGETDNPALADFAADVVTSSGSQKYPKDALRRFLFETSTQLSGNGDLRGITYSMTATRPNFDKAWDMLASLIVAPATDQVEFKNIMQRRVTDVKRRIANPEGYASFISDSLIKLGNPVLGKIVHEPDVERIDLATISAFLKRVTERSRMLIVIVGNISQADVRKKLALLAGVPAGSFSRPQIPALAASASPTVNVIDRKTPTTYVTSSFVGPRAGEPDYWALQIGLSHLRNILFEELRTKRNLTYAPGAFLASTLGQSRGVLSVSSTNPDSSIVLMYQELARMKRGEIDETDLNDSRQVFITAYYTRQMTNDGVANAIYSAQRNAGDWRFAYSLNAINSVTKDAVAAAFAKYARNMQVGVVGVQAAVTSVKYVFTE